MMFHISTDLKKYFTDDSIRKSVDHFLGRKKDHEWLELWSETEDQKVIYDNLQNYNNAWISSKKIQSDYYDFLVKLWDCTWGLLLQDKELANRLTPEVFRGVQTTWKESGWQLDFEVSAKTYDELWLYLEEDDCAASIDIRIQFGKNEFSCCGDKSEKKLKHWEFRNDKGENPSEGFFTVKHKINFWKTKASDIEEVMLEMASFLKNDIFD